MNENSSRRDLLKLASLTTLGAGLAYAADSPRPGRSMSGVPFEAKETVRLGVIDSSIPTFLDRVRDPTGSPVATNSVTAA